MTTWYVVYDTLTGNAVSFTTIIDLPLPAGLDYRQLDDSEVVLLDNGTGYWNPTTLRLEPTPETP